jgi:2-haloacid dehalogenase
VWARISLHGHAPQRQVSRAAHPLLRSFFFPEPGAATEALNAGSPAGDVAAYSGVVLRAALYVAELWQVAGPDQHAAAVIAAFLPDQLRYRPGEPALFAPGTGNGRGLHDDAFGTLDLDTLHPTLDRIFGDPAALRLWFANLITYSEALTLAGAYVPFTEIGAAVLRMLAATRDITISDADAAELTDRFATMPPHPEVPAALRRLRDNGFRLFTLTDNTLAISGRQLEHAGVIDVFERRFRVDETGRRHPPPPEAYHSVAAELNVDPGKICLIACHVWDTIGAQAAGWQAARILRPGNAPLDVGPQPDYIGRDLSVIADQLIEKYGCAGGR